MNRIDHSIRSRRIRAVLCTALVFCAVAMPAYAEGSDPLTTINNLSAFVFSSIQAIGAILLGLGIQRSAATAAECGIVRIVASAAGTVGHMGYLLNKL